MYCGCQFPASRSVSPALGVKGAGYILCFVLGWGIYGMWAAMLLDQLTMTLCGYIRFKRGKWRYIDV